MSHLHLIEKTFMLWNCSYQCLRNCFIKRRTHRFSTEEVGCFDTSSQVQNLNLKQFSYLYFSHYYPKSKYDIIMTSKHYQIQLKSNLKQKFKFRYLYTTFLTTVKAMKHHKTLAFKRVNHKNALHYQSYF